jgi:hypothetical protein
VVAADWVKSNAWNWLAGGAARLVKLASGPPDRAFRAERGLIRAAAHAGRSVHDAHVGVHRAGPSAPRPTEKIRRLVPPIAWYSWAQTEFDGSWTTVCR